MIKLWQERLRIPQNSSYNTEAEKDCILRRELLSYSTINILKIWTPENIIILVLNWECLLYGTVKIPKNADRMTNREDCDQTAHKEQSDLCLHCLLRLSVPILRIFMKQKSTLFA